MLGKQKKHQLSSIHKEKVVKLYRQALAADVPLETVQHKIATFLVRNQTALQFEQKADEQHQVRLKKQTPFLSRLFFHLAPAIFIFLGFFLVGSATWPIFSYFFLGSSEVTADALLAPIPKEQVLSGLSGVVPKVQANTGSKDSESFPTGESEPMIKPTVIEGELDYTNLNNWFEQDTLAAESSEEQSNIEYRIDIPSLNIENARIRIGGTNLDKSLIQYPGTAMPGESGAPVIFGHSVLRQFYNPSVNNSQRYISIFSTIMTLKPGEKIYVTYDNIRYTYIVKEKRDVKPEDTFILSQNFDLKELKLVTCRPEGTYFMRGVVTAELESTQ